MTDDMDDADRGIASLMDTAIEERRGKVLLLRLAGMTYTDIAAECGVSVTTVRKDYDLALDAQTILPEKGIARQQAIITEIIRANLRQAVAGDKDAAGVILKYLDREAKLNGWDAPTRVYASLNSVDAANETARLMDSIAENTAIMLARHQPQKEIHRARGEVIDAEVTEPMGGVGGAGDDAAAVRPEGGRPGDHAGSQDGAARAVTGVGDVPDADAGAVVVEVEADPDDGWADVDDD